MDAGKQKEIENLKGKIFQLRLRGDQCLGIGCVEEHARCLEEISNIERQIILLKEEGKDGSEKN